LFTDLIRMNLTLNEFCNAKSTSEAITKQKWTVIVMKIHDSFVTIDGPNFTSFNSLAKPKVKCNIYYS
jgi:hypothetical protein